MICCLVTFRNTLGSRFEEDCDLFAPDYICSNKEDKASMLSS